MMMKSGCSVKRMLFLALCLVLLVACGACAEQSVPYSAIYGADNPVPAIAKNVRPAIVQVIAMQEDWSQQTGVTKQDLGYGSGVYIDARGYIVTNYHIIQGADLVEIMTLSGERISCDVVGYDDGTDIAVLKVTELIEAEPVPMGDSEKLEVGELAIAIGNPGDTSGVLFGTVTVGIISALDRQDINANNFSRKVNVIQTDAAINVGNSGGALLNAKGELIGIPTMKLSYDFTTVYEGLGFAVPVNTIKPIVQQLIEQGKVVRPRLGISVVDLEGPNEPLKNFPPAGAQVMVVEPTGAAGQAGIMAYDIIMEVDGVRIKGSMDLLGEIDKHTEGDTLKLKVYRGIDPFTGGLIDDPETLELNVELKLLD